MTRSARPTIGVLGAGGMLGYAVCEYFARTGTAVLAIRRSEFDIGRDPLDKLERLVGSVRHIVNCAGVIKPMIAATCIEDVLRVNTVFPHNLARLGDRLGIQVFHVTTDCVYSGARGGYIETDTFDADDVYGMSKSGGDAAPAMVLRTSIIGEERASRRSLLEWVRAQRGGTVKGFLNHRWNGVTTVHFAEIIHQLIEGALYQRGLFHIHSPDVVTKCELLRLIAEAYELDLKIEPVEADAACDRSLMSQYDLAARLCTKSLRQQLDDMRRFFTPAPSQTARATIARARP
jgi:dTDP-4-dehydrorhamnose reductase